MVIWKCLPESLKYIRVVFVAVGPFQVYYTDEVDTF